MNFPSKNINNNSPIGFFDSGLGGLSILKEVNKLLPKENCIYLADSKNAPYGEKSSSKIISFSVKNVDVLIKMGCKIIVVACNTATTNAINYLRNHYDVPFIGIEPATKPAALKTKTGKIGVLATKGTLTSDFFTNTSEKFIDSTNIIKVEGNGLVEKIESGNISLTKDMLKKYLKPMIEADVDNVVLGCTHYPFLIHIIQEIIPKHIHIVDSGLPVAKQTKNILQQYRLVNQEGKYSKNIIYTNHKLYILEEFLKTQKIKTNQTQFLDF